MATCVWCYLWHSEHIFPCRATWTPATEAARRSAPRVAYLGLHRPAQLSSAHHPHRRPGLPCHGPQQDSYHWQDQVHAQQMEHLSLRACLNRGSKLWWTSTLSHVADLLLQRLKSRRLFLGQASLFSHLPLTRPDTCCIFCRLRVNCVGVFDVLTFDNSQNNHLALMPQYQVLAAACHCVCV